MRCQVLTNPNYHSDKFVEIDPNRITRMEEKTMKVLFGGTHRVTVVYLEGGLRYILKGDFASALTAAREEVQTSKAA